MGVDPALLTGPGQDSFHLVSVKVAELHLALATAPRPLEALQKEKLKQGFSERKAPASFPLHERQSKHG